MLPLVLEWICKLLPQHMYDPMHLQQVSKILCKGSNRQYLDFVGHIQFLLHILSLGFFFFKKYFSNIKTISLQAVQNVRVDALVYGPHFANHCLECNSHSKCVPLIC